MDKDNKVGHAEMKKLPYIIALDFDGTLVEDKYPEIGAKNETLFQQAIEWQQNGCKIILWTCRTGDDLTKAVEYCEKQGLVFDAVNRNIDETQALFGGDSRKVYANVYIDDKSLRPSIPLVFPRYEPTRDFKPWKLSRSASRAEW